MDIPVLTRFINGLKLFFESKRLRWFFLIFMLSVVFVYTFRELGNFFPILAGGFIAIIGGVFPTFFMLAAFLSLLGLQRYIASEESYKASFGSFLIWLVISGVVYFILWLTGLVFWVMIVIAFLGWIGFQAYISSRSALGYAESVQIKTRSRVVSLLFGIMNILSYVIIIGAFLVLLIWYSANTLPADFDLGLVAAALFGTLLAAGFNFLNGIIILRERKQTTADNLALLGLFIAAYAAYFQYNILKPASITFDLFSLIVDMGISIFFILYAMSAVGLTLASRAHLDTRFKISIELAATITFFLASGYVVVQALFGTFALGLLGARMADVIKLIVFPVVALVMELFFIRSSRKAPAAAPEPTETPEVPEEAEVEPEEGEGEVPQPETPEIDEPSEEVPDSSEEMPEDADEGGIQEESELDEDYE
jgi:hypothetical protein